MCLKSEPSARIPEETYRLGQRVMKKKALMIGLEAELSEVIDDEAFAALYSPEGRPAVSPALLAKVTLLQFVENLTDRQAADMVATRIDWKYVLHLDLEATGFDASVLSEFRSRLVSGEAESLIFDRVVAKLKEKGLVKGRCQRTDALAVVGAVRVLTRLELAMETMRVALVALEAHEFSWMQAHVPAEWAVRYGPWTQEERRTGGGERGRAQAEAELEQTGRDLHALTTALNDASTPGRILKLPAIEVARTVFEQQFEVEEGKVAPRKQLSVAGAEVIRTPIDPEVRYSQKRDQDWEGYKAHVTETVDEDTPRIVTDVLTTAATTADLTEVSTIQDRIEARGLPPADHLVDSAYVSGKTLAESAARGIRLVGPIQPDSSPQARQERGITLDQFEIDTERKVATCPAGARSVVWSEGEDERGPRVQIHFAASACGTCPLRDRCVSSRSGPRRTLHLREHHSEVRKRRQEQQTPEFKRAYAGRSGIEATLSEQVRGRGLRNARYRGLRRVHLQHLMIGAATNLARAARWNRGDRPVTHRPPSLREFADISARRAQHEAQRAADQAQPPPVFV